MIQFGRVSIATLGVSLILVAPGGNAQAQDVPFAAPHDIAEGTVRGLTSIDAGDLDNDGLADVVAVEGGTHAGGRQTFAWFESPTDVQGSWTRHDISHNASLRKFLGAVKVADMDGDGRLDIILSSDNHSGSSRQADIFVFVNPGASATGTWQHARANGSTLPYHHINDMEVADMDGDGKLDIIVRSLEPNQIHIFFQNSISSYVRKSIDTGLAKSEGLAVGDIDRDGRMDISYTGYWLQGPASPRSQSYAKKPVDDRYADVNQNTKEFIQDIDRDGLPDVVIGPAESFRSGGNHDLAWYKNPGSGYSTNWSKTVIQGNTNDMHTVKGGDIDADGDTDVVIGIPWGSQQVRIYYNDGAGGFPRSQVLTTGKGLYSGVVADLGGNNTLDIIGQDTYAGSSKPWVYENLSGGGDKPPVASDDTATVVQGGSVAIAVLANDADPDGTLDPLSVVVTLNPVDGTVQVNPDGTITYLHNGTGTANDSFEYQVSDEGGLESNVATVTVSVTADSGGNQPPVASDDTATVLQGNSVTVDVLANDADPDGTLDLLSVVVTRDPSDGAVLVNADGTITYTHDGSGTADDSFEYRVSDDGGLESNLATVTVSVTADSGGDQPAPGKPNPPGNLIAE